jgi:hypothetical protein
MNIRTRIPALVLLLAVVFSLAGGLAMLATTPAEAARCCWVMVCSNTPPYVCWEECRTCPKFP